MNLQFLCGCRTGNVESRENLRTMDAVEIDDEGMMRCAIHHARLEGWRSLPQIGVSGDFRFAGCSPAEIEGYKVFGEIPWSWKRPMKLEATTVEDRRDNRDPVEDQDEILASWRSSRNGGNNRNGDTEVTASRLRQSL